MTDIDTLTQLAREGKVCGTCYQPGHVYHPVATINDCTCPDLWAAGDVAACPFHGTPVRCKTHGHPFDTCPGWRERCKRA